MFPEVINPLYWIAAASFFCSLGGASYIPLDSNKKGCFLHTVNQNRKSPPFELQDYHETYVQLNHIFKRNSYTQIMTDNGTCLVGLSHHQYNEDLNCKVQFHTDGEHTSLIFRRREGSLILRKLMEIDVDLSGNTRTLVISSNDTVNVAFDCPGNCYQFEKATIHKKIQGNQYDFKIFGEIDDISAINDSRIMVKRGQSWMRNYGIYLKQLITKSTETPLTFNSTYKQFLRQHEINPTNKEHQPLTFEFQAFLNKSVDQGFCCSLIMQLAASSFNGLRGTAAFEKAQNIPSRDIYLDFGYTTGIRWSFCRQQEGNNDIDFEKITVEEYPWQGSNGYYFLALAIVCGVLIVLLTCQCCCYMFLAHRLTRALDILQNNTNLSSSCSQHQNQETVTSSEDLHVYTNENMENTMERASAVNLILQETMDGYIVMKGATKEKLLDDKQEEQSIENTYLNMSDIKDELEQRKLTTPL